MSRLQHLYIDREEDVEGSLRLILDELKNRIDRHEGEDYVSHQLGVCYNVKIVWQ